VGPGLRQAASSAGVAENAGPVARFGRSRLDAPEEDKRRAAQAAAEESGNSKPSDLLALAVFFSGGSIADPDAPPDDPPPFIANKLVAGCVQLAAVGFTPNQNAERFQTAIKLAKG
jgi:hypothetical protein